MDNNPSRRSILKGMGGSAMLATVSSAKGRLVDGKEENQVDSPLEELESEQLDPENHPGIVEEVRSKPGVQRLSSKFEGRGYHEKRVEITQVTERDGTKRHVVQLQFDGPGIQEAVIQYNNLQKVGKSDSLDLSVRDHTEKEIIRGNNIIGLVVTKNKRLLRPSSEELEQFAVDEKTNSIKTYKETIREDRSIITEAKKDSASSDEVVCGNSLALPSCGGGGGSTCDDDECLAPTVENCDQNWSCLLKQIGSIIVAAGACGKCLVTAGLLTLACAVCLGSVLVAGGTVAGCNYKSNCDQTYTCAPEAWAGPQCI